MKRSSSYWKEDEEPKFPVAIVNVMVETLTALRPKTKLFTSLKAATDATDKIELEMIKTLQDKAPDLTGYLLKNDSPNNNNNNNSSRNPKLMAIAEEGDEDQEEDDKEMELEELEFDEDDIGVESVHSNSRSRSASQMGNLGEDNSQEETSQQYELSQDNDGSGEEEFDGVLF